MTKFSDKDKAQTVAALRKRLEKVEKLVSALVSDVEFIKRRLDKVEVVKAGPQTRDVSRDVTCSDPDETQIAETE